jgi:hypothetical protein
MVSTRDNIFYIRRTETGKSLLECQTKKYKQNIAPKINLPRLSKNISKE